MDPGAIPAANSVPFLLPQLLLLAWLLAEFAVRWRFGRGGGSAPAARVRDRGSFWAIVLAVVAGLGSAEYLASTGLGGDLPAYSWIAGAAAAVLGIAFRSWAIAVLGRYFSVVVRVLPEHQLVRSGPYRWIRHPSYTGAFFVILGVAITYGSIVGAVICAGLELAAFLYRIGVEERLLQDRFGAEYREYSQTTWRIFPGIY